MGLLEDTEGLEESLEHATDLEDGDDIPNTGLVIVYWDEPEASLFSMNKPAAIKAAMDIGQKLSSLYDGITLPRECDIPAVAPYCYLLHEETKYEIFLDEKDINWDEIEEKGFIGILTIGAGRPIKEIRVVG